MLGVVFFVFDGRSQSAHQGQQARFDENGLQPHQVGNALGRWIVHRHRHLCLSQSLHDAIKG